VRGGKAEIKAEAAHAVWQKHSQVLSFAIAWVRNLSEAVQSWELRGVSVIETETNCISKIFSRISSQVSTPINLDRRD
jgi:hypothetical protein